jgi:hypothetical protein
MPFFKDRPDIANAALRPPRPAATPAGSAALVRRLAETHDRIGGLLRALGTEVGIPVEAALAVWQIESGGLPFIEGRPVLRFENHKYFDHWGRRNVAAFDLHFQFGGRGGIEGKPWHNHKFRDSAGEAWASFHGDQDREYRVFGFAGGLSGLEAACLSSSFGGPQILGSNFGALGYPSSSALFQAFQQSERWQVCGFFDFCRDKKLIDEIKGRKWTAFASGYNGPGQAESYGAKIKDAFEAAETLDLGEAP